MPGSRQASLRPARSAGERTLLRVAGWQHQDLLAPPQVQQDERPGARQGAHEVVVVLTGARVQQVHGSGVGCAPREHAHAGDAPARSGDQRDAVADRTEQQVERGIVAAGEPQRRAAAQQRPSPPGAVGGHRERGTLAAGDHAGGAQPQVGTGHRARRTATLIGQRPHRGQRVARPHPPSAVTCAGQGRARGRQQSAWTQESTESALGRRSGTC